MNFVWLHMSYFQRPSTFIKSIEIAVPNLRFCKKMKNRFQVNHQSTIEQMQNVWYDLNTTL